MIRFGLVHFQYRVGNREGMSEPKYEIHALSVSVKIPKNPVEVYLAL